MKQNIRLVERNRKIRNELLNSGVDVVNKMMLFENLDPKLFCAILYGCEGSKYPSSNVVSLVNSDPLLIKSFVSLMRKSFILDESKWKVHLQIHTNQKFLSLKSYWSGLLNIPEDQFYKPTVTVSSGKKHKDGYKGTCSVRYADYKIQLGLIGIFNEFLRKSGKQGGYPDRLRDWFAKPRRGNSSVGSTPTSSALRLRSRP